MGDEVVKAVEHQVIREEEFGAASILPGMDPTMLHLPIAPARKKKKASAV